MLNTSGGEAHPCLSPAAPWDNADSFHVIVKLTDDRDHSRRDYEPGKHSPQERAVYGIVGLLRLDEARV